MKKILAFPFFLIRIFIDFFASPPFPPPHPMALEGFLSHSNISTARFPLKLPQKHRRDEFDTRDIVGKYINYGSVNSFSLNIQICAGHIHQTGISRFIDPEESQHALKFLKPFIRLFTASRYRLTFCAVSLFIIPIFFSSI